MPERLSVARVREALAGRARSVVEGPHVARRAAVAAIVRAGEGGGAEILFIKRAEHPEDPWSGHMAFPGGRVDPGDAGLVEAALRETREEIGLDLPRHGEAIGALDDLPAIGRGARDGLVVTPFVFALSSLPALSLDPTEVDEVRWAPLAPLMAGERDATFDYEWRGLPMRFPAYRVGPRVVWGMTYRMLQLLFERLRG